MTTTFETHPPISLSLGLQQRAQLTSALSAMERASFLFLGIPDTFRFPSTTV